MLCFLYSSAKSNLSITSEKILGINLIFYIIQANIVPVGNDHLKLIQVINHFTAKKSFSVFQHRLIDYNCRSLGLDPFHHSLNGALAEIVAIKAILSPMSLFKYWGRFCNLFCVIIGKFYPEIERKLCSRSAAVLLYFITNFCYMYKSSYLFSLCRCRLDPFSI